MRVRPGGFTLIELMIVVAIIGILASIAIPAFSKFQLRSRQAERALIGTAIEKAVDEYFARDSRFPRTASSPLISFYSLPTTPALPAQPSKRPMNLGAGDWPRLNLNVVGHVYYSYQSYGYSYEPGTLLGRNDSRYANLTAYGDLDGDGFATCYVMHERYWSGAALIQEVALDRALVAGPSWGCF